MCHVIQTITVETVLFCTLCDKFVSKFKELKNLRVSIQATIKK